MAFGRRQPTTEERPPGIELPGGQYAPDPMELEEVLQIKGQAERAREAAAALAPITDQATANAAADALKALGYVRKDADALRKKLGRPYSDAKKAVDAGLKELAAPVDGAEKAIKAQLVTWQKAEAERVEAERLEAERKAQEEQAHEDAQAAEEGRASHHVPAERVPAAPKGGRGQSGAKATASKRLTYDIIDEAKLPDEYVERVPRRSKILADVRQGIVIPGVEPKMVDDVRVS